MKVVKQIFSERIGNRKLNHILTFPSKQIKFVAVEVINLQNFSQLFQKLSLNEIVSILNEYLGIVVNVANQFGGEIDQIIRDNCLLVFGAYSELEDEEIIIHSVQTALEMKQKIELWKKKKEERQVFLNWGIGISYGKVFIGEIGSEDRKVFTVLGECVNNAFELAKIAVNSIYSDFKIAEKARKLRLEIKEVDFQIKTYELVEKR